MALKASSTQNIVTAMGSLIGGMNFIAAVNGHPMTMDAATFRRLVVATGSQVVAQNLQDVINGTATLTAQSIQYLAPAFASAAVAADIIANI